jgi:putative restriction endonuclease
MGAIHVQEHWNDISISDSFVVPANKRGTANGEAKLFIGNQGDELRAFFGDRGFRWRAAMYRSDLLDALQALRPEYMNTRGGYRRQLELPGLWVERRREISALRDEVIRFEIVDRHEIEPPRVYIQSEDDAWRFLRSVPLSDLCSLRISKATDDQGPLLIFRVIPTIRASLTPWGNATESTTQLTEDLRDLAWNKPKTTETERLVSARIGQGDFRDALVAHHPKCVITGIDFLPVLIASHIKDWAVATDEERLDAENGVLLSANLDKLFDRKLLTIEFDSAVIRVSSLVPQIVQAALGIRDRLPIHDQRGIAGQRRREYLRFHNQEFRP